MGGAPLLGPAAAQSATATAVAAAEDDWRGLTNQARAVPVDWTAVMATDGLQKQQRVLSQALDRARRERVRNSASPEDWMRIQACAGTWASVWLTVTPTEHGLSFLDAEYAALVRFRLRLPLRPGGGPCALLRRVRGTGPNGRTPWYDAEGDHAHSCQRNIIDSLCVTRKESDMVLEQRSLRVPCAACNV